METRSLLCPLTLEEKRQRGESLAQKRQEWDSVESAKKAAVQHAKAEQDRIDSEADRLAEAIRTGHEHRDVEVIDRKNLDTRTMDTVRCDTGEVIESRLLTGAERQVAIFPAPVEVPRSENRRKKSDPEA